MTDDTTTTADTDHARAELADLIKDFRFAMITTLDAQGKLVAHPLTIQEAEFDGDLWFLVSKTSSPATNLYANDHAGVSLSSNDHWVSLSGSAALVDDRSKVRELWNPVVEAWFTNGPDDPDVGLLKFSADSAEYWDSPGGRLASVVSFVKAKLTGESFDATNEKLDL
ncbi:pyridoxamine 5'-phosphate oxidase family protein [Herbiconiux sp. CPCC 205763]|uniref:Pyridoxamine 5'-phosphate oxidase family protein n=1 Tax=Herbiconiux aconitum TaxID=2970913 RepID=A0ABT2GR65_9MICO|nr:pyridoxamine 5'-phosphate oxidase family protein [Herbiconiux aconitum]MCS5718721.1 pyridoxamine 5'-phosphate oxidase family protein [Herbiconiux aconitum]